ncbi:DUF1345 domain-containing protein [Kineococcus glutinatus]|uniref:DUF1345 domain-containing protein n=1 Tax=Kineococcus glutinatus TaxID=1070872 RepID=A0ABP9I5N5_9ACTN
MPSSTTAPSRTGSRVWSSSWLVTENGRYNLSFAVAFVVAVPLVPLSHEAGFAGADSTAVTAAGVYALMLACYAALTLGVFSHNMAACVADGRGAGAPSLARRLLTVHRPGAGIAVTFAAVALGAAVWFASFAPDAATPLQAAVAATTTVLLVVAAWCTMAVTYAADYARRAADGGLDFPGAEPPAFADFLYFSVGVSTTFGTTDVTVTTRAVRRTVLGHSLVAFGFNTVVLALLVSALLS